MNNYVVELRNKTCVYTTSTYSLAQLTDMWVCEKVVMFEDCSLASDCIAGIHLVESWEDFDDLVEEEDATNEHQEFDLLAQRVQVKPDPIETKAIEIYKTHTLSELYNWEEIPQSLRDIFLDHAQQKVKGNQ